MTIDAFEHAAEAASRFQVERDVKMAIEITCPIAGKPLVRIFGVNGASSMQRLVTFEDVRNANFDVLTATVALVAQAFPVRKTHAS